MIFLIPQSEGRPDAAQGSAASAFLGGRSAYDRSDQARLNLSQFQLPKTPLRESHRTGLTATNTKSTLDHEIDQLLSKVQAGKLSPSQLTTANREDQALAEGWEAVSPREGTRGAELLTKLRTRVAVREAVLQKIASSPLTIDSLQAQVIQEANTESANGAYLKRRKRNRRHAREAMGLIREARSPEDLESLLREFNQCHSPADGKFCSGMSRAGQAAMGAARKAKSRGGDWRQAAAGAYLSTERVQYPRKALAVARGSAPASRYAAKIKQGRFEFSPWERVVAAGNRLMARSLQRRRPAGQPAVSDDSMAHMHRYNLLQAQRRAKRFAQ